MSGKADPRPADPSDSRSASGRGGRAAAPRAISLRLLRRVSQAVFLAGFLALFALAADLPRPPVPVDLYLRADPLIALSAMVSLRRLILPHLWYALPVVALTVLFGRVFCGWICPMGSCIDGLERVCGLRGRPRGGDGRWQRLKYYLLIAMVVTLIVPAAHRSNEELGLTQSVGLSAVYLMDPISLLTRTLTWVGLPALQWALHFKSETVTSWSYSDFVEERASLNRALAPVQLALHTVTRPAHFRLGLATLLVFIGIVALGRYERRFWCRNLCPLGALLGVIGRLSPMRLEVSEKCNQCMLCARECKTGAIEDDPKRRRGPECSACYSCVAVCPQGAISVVAGYDEAREDRLELDRRRVLGAVAAGLAAVAMPKAALGAKRTSATRRVLKLSSLRLIRPPGALAEPEFVTACVRCGECMKACMTNTLQPAVGEGGLEALGTPVLVPRAAPCAHACTLCGEVCPTRAIEPFRVEEKRHLYLGAASVDRGTCIAWARGRECMICQEVCPYLAIRSSFASGGTPRPVVDEAICVGCGMCEWVCPVEPLGAIRVGAMGDRRHLGRERQRLFREDAEPSPAEGGQDRSESPYPGQ